MLPGIGPSGIRRLLEVYGSAEEILRAEKGSLRAAAGLRKNQLAGFGQIHEYREKAEKELERLTGMGATALCWEDEEFPSLLQEISDPPVVLYALGKLELLNRQKVAIVGSRSATTYGRRVARTLGKQLSWSDVTVVSGLALGIDTEAHQGALKGSGSTIAVLGCGLDVIYPRQNRELFHEIRRQGLILTEYLLNTKPEGFRFPARNRIIAGISQGVAVVEAARKSGSLITAQLGLDFNREIFAVPGQIDSYKSEGAHWLLQQGAQLIMGAEDVLNTLGLKRGLEIKKNGQQEKNISGLEPDAVALLEAIEPYPMTRDELLVKTNLLPNRLSELFLLLELEGCVEILPGDLVRRITI